MKQDKQGAKKAKQIVDLKPDINTASKEEFLGVPGLSEELAEDIIKHRPYNSVQELYNIPQIGEWTVEYLKEALRIPGIVERNIKGD